MAKPTSSQLDRSRPSSRLQAQSMLETTPVLFRLPNVQLSTLPTVADKPSEALLEFQRVTAETDAPTFTDQGTSSAEIRADRITAQAASSSATMSQSSRVNPGETELIPIQEDKKSWWEHWSSGVVLILLLLAAYFASIAVLRARNRSMAREKIKPEVDTANLDIESLQNVQIPVITEQPKQDQPREMAGALDQPGLSGSLAVADPARVQSSPSSVDGLTNVDALAVADPARVQSPSSSVNGLTKDDAADALANSLSGDLPLDSTSPNNSLSTPTLGTLENSIATAQLLEPTQMPGQLPLLPQQPMAGGVPNFPAQSASTPVAGGVAAGSDVDGLGKSPTLYDGASGTTSAAMPQLASQPVSQTPTNSSLSTPSLPAFTPASLGTNTGAQSFTLANTSSSSQNPVRATSTPDSSGEVEAIIRAYLELMKAGQSASGTTAVPAQPPATQLPSDTPVNRYQLTR